MRCLSSSYILSNPLIRFLDAAVYISYVNTVVYLRQQNAVYMRSVVLWIEGINLLKPIKGGAIHG